MSAETVIQNLSRRLVLLEKLVLQEHERLQKQRRQLEEQQQILDKLMAASDVRSVLRFKRRNK